MFLFITFLHGAWSSHAWRNAPCFDKIAEMLMLMPIKGQGPVNFDKTKYIYLKKDMQIGTKFDLSKI
jgi:hypothetical protein